MTALDADVVDRWVAGLRRAGLVVPDTIVEVLTEAFHGRAPVGPLGPDGRIVSKYLHGIAIGVAGTVAEDPPPPAGMCLTAGLLAGAAALEAVDPAVAAAARVAGMAAVDRAVEADDVVAVVLTAARSTAQEPIRAVVAALARAVRPPGPVPDPASCGAGPDDLAGQIFAAEITFTSSAVGADLAELRRSLGPLADEAWFWPAEDETKVHLHTHQAGPAIAEAFAAGLVFGLRVTARRATESDR